MKDGQKWRTHARDVRHRGNVELNDLFIEQSHVIALIPPYAIRATIKVVGSSNSKVRLTGYHGDSPAVISTQLRDWRIRSATGDANEIWLANKAKDGCSIEIVSYVTCFLIVQRGASA